METKDKLNTKESNWSKFLLGFGIVTVISGIYLIIQEDYMIGIFGSITGFFLIYQQKMGVAKSKDLD